MSKTTTKPKTKRRRKLGHGGRRDNQTGRPATMDDSVGVSLMLPRLLRDRLANRAERAGVSFGAEVRRLLELGLAHD